MASKSTTTLDRKIDKHHFLLICLGLVLATAVAFEPVRNNGFVEYDDYQYLIRNQVVQQGVTKESVIWAFTSFHASNWHPLTWISHMIDCGLFGLNPLWHHLENILFHICNSLLLFILLRRTTGEVWQSTVVAALFAVHPAHVESVAWAAERKDVLSTFFWLLTMLAYVDYVKKPGSWRYVLVLILFCLGLMTKPMLVTLPLMLLLFDFWPLGRLRFAPVQGIDQDDRYRRLGLWRSIFEKIPFFALSACSALVTVLAQGKARAMAQDKMFGFVPSMGNALISYLAYIGKMLYPKDLAVLYPLQMEGIGPWKPLLALTALMIITSAVLYAGRKKGYLLVGWMWYLITLLPVIGLVQVGAQAMADRYTYVPSIGFFIMLLWALGDIFDKFKISVVIRAVLTVGILVVCILATRVQVGYWQNNFTLFGHAIEVTENNYIMHNNFGLALNKNNRLDEAIEHFQEVLRINPNYIRAKANIGHVLRRQEKMDEAIEYFKQALSAKEDWPEVYNELGRAYAYKGMADEAIECYKRAIELKPHNPHAYNNWGMILEDQGKTDQAMEMKKKSYELLQQQ